MNIRDDIVGIRKDAYFLVLSLFFLTFKCERVLDMSSQLFLTPTSNASTASTADSPKEEDHYECPN